MKSEQVNSSSEDVQRIRELLDFLSERDFESAKKCFDVNVLFELPYPPLPEVPTSIEGRENLFEFIVQGTSAFTPYIFTIIEIYEIANSSKSIAEYYSDSSKVKATGEPYGNKYIAIFDFKDGLITYWKEYLNPISVYKALDRL